MGAITILVPGKYVLHVAGSPVTKFGHDPISWDWNRMAVERKTAPRIIKIHAFSKCMRFIRTCQPKNHVGMKNLPSKS